LKLTFLKLIFCKAAKKGAIKEGIIFTLIEWKKGGLDHLLVGIQFRQDKT
jgi:hypothetical protein